MNTINTPTPIHDAIANKSAVSHYEIFLLCCAAFLLAVAYPAKESIPPQALPVTLPAPTETPVELEANNGNSQDIIYQGDEVSTAVLLEHIDPEMLTEIPASEPAS